MLKKLSAALCALLLLSSPLIAADASAPVPEFVMTKDQSFLKFIALQNGAPVTGEFKDFSAKILFDPHQMDKSKLTVEVTMKDVAGPSDDMISSLKLPEWFSVDAFPKATFTSTVFHMMPGTDEKQYYVDGELTLRGQKKPLTLNFSFEHLDDKHAVATGFTTIPRKDFGVGQGEWAKEDVIRNDVRVEFRIVADRK